MSSSASTADAAVEPSANISRRHHYVPRFLLAGFTPSDAQSDKLLRFDRGRSKPEPRHPKVVAFEYDYYSVEVGGKLDDRVESYIATVETIAAPIIRSMIANRVMPTETDYADLMYFLGLMNGRSPAFRDTLVRFYEESMHLPVKLMASSRENY